MAAQDRGRGRSRSRFPVRLEAMIDLSTAERIRSLADVTNRTHSQVTRLLLAYGLHAWTGADTEREAARIERHRQLGIDDG